jgi:hypothetical protein
MVAALTENPVERTLSEHQRIFDRIWWQHPERQNRTSSSWWFFILFPEGPRGYGPRQLMFSVAARVGDRIRVNDTWLPGMDLDRPTENGVDQFDAISVGWHGDEQEVHDRLVNQPAEATLSRDGSLTAWADREDGARRGGEIRAAADRPLGLEAHFIGDEGEAQFEAWGELDSRITAPVQAMDLDTIAGGVDLVAWRRMQFDGEFALPTGRERLSGTCYFQRVCLNLPLFPWKWIWAVFPDGSAFSAMIPYVGTQLFRTGYTFHASQTLERATIPLQQSALWYDGPTDELVTLDTASVTPTIDGSPHPDFKVRATNDDGDELAFVASTYGHARNHIDRPILRGLTESHWSYNEYLFQMEELRGQIRNRPVNQHRLGQAFGTLEYAWGLGS